MEPDLSHVEILPTAQSLIDRPLTDFKVIEMTEVYKTDSGATGRKVKSLGFFKDPAVAKVFKDYQIDAAFHATKKAFVLTDGKDGFVIETSGVEIVNEEAETTRLRRKALEKLSPEERKLLGFQASFPIDDPDEDK